MRTPEQIKNSNRMRDDIIRIMEENPGVRALYPLLHYMEAECLRIEQWWENAHAATEDDLKGKLYECEKQVSDLDEECTALNRKNEVLVQNWTARLSELEMKVKFLEPYKERYEYAVIDGTDLRLKIEQHEDRYDQLDEEYQDLVRICTHLYRYGNREDMISAINEASHGDDWEKFKNHLGV